MGQWWYRDIKSTLPLRIMWSFCKSLWRLHPCWFAEKDQNAINDLQNANETLLLFTYFIFLNSSRSSSHNIVLILPKLKNKTQMIWNVFIFFYFYPSYMSNLTSTNTTDFQTNCCKKRTRDRKLRNWTLIQHVTDHRTLDFQYQPLELPALF